MTIISELPELLSPIMQGATATPNVVEENMDNLTRVLSYLDAGHNLFITGVAGSGKSHLLRQLKDKFGDKLHLTATTGISALNINGTTIHSWAKLGIGSVPAQRIAQGIEKDRNTYSRIMACKYLAIDEISMLSDKMLTLLHQVLVLVRENTKPFGGIKVLLFGDFLQLPPVLKAGEGLCLGSMMWMAAQIRTVLLTTNFRQKNDTEYYDLLKDVRKGLNTQISYQRLQKRVGVTYPKDITKLVANRDTAKTINEGVLKALTTKAHTFTGTYTGKDADIQNYKATYADLEHLVLKEGAKVMLNYNINLKAGLVNGLVGYVEGFTAEGNPLVIFENNSDLIEIKPRSWTVENADGDTIFEFTQLPLQLAWATTIHKSQGCTFNQLHVDLSRCFAPGQAYVALSRVRSLEGLYLEPFSSRVLITDPQMVAFYQYLETATVTPEIK